MSEIIKRPLIIAHRGASAAAPENTLAAFRKALEIGAEGIEFDVQLAKDGVPVVFHDFGLERVGRKKGCVGDFSSRELQNLDVGSWFNSKYPTKAAEQFSAEKIPTLKQLLNLLDGYKRFIYIELKSKSAGNYELVKAVCELITDSKLFPFFVVKSFDLEMIRQMKTLLPEVRTAALFAPKIRAILQDKTKFFEKAVKYKADEISIHRSMATKSFVQKAGEKGFLTTIWTANNPVWVKRAADLSINAVITDCPAELLAKKREIFPVW